MHTRTHRRAFLLLLTAFAAAARAARDPFLPIGYSRPTPVTELPKEPEVPEPVKPAPPPQPAPPPVKPITAADWDEARKALKISGITKSVMPNTGATTIQAMINRQTYTEGDTLTYTNNAIRFQWRIEAAAGLDVALIPLNAERIKPAAADKNQAM